MPKNPGFTFSRKVPAKFELKNQWARVRLLAVSASQGVISFTCYSNVSPCAVRSQDSRGT